MGMLKRKDFWIGVAVGTFVVPLVISKTKVNVPGTK